MKHRKLLDESFAEYMLLIRKYHATLDLVSDRALARLSDLVREAEAYAEPIASFHPSRPILDVGSGVGLPGIVIAIALPDRPVVLVERRRRRATFLKICAAQLGLTNAFVIEDDVQNVSAERVWGLVSGMEPPSVGAWDGGSADALPAPADASAESSAADSSAADSAAADAGGSHGGAGLVGAVTAQAVASFRDVYCLTRHLHAERVLMVSRKGSGWREEVSDIPADSGRASAVRNVSELAGGGTLVAIEVPGGLPCPPSA